MPVSTPPMYDRPATLADVPEIVNNMLSSGMEEYYRKGSHPLLSISADVLTSTCHVCINSDGKIVALVGFTDFFGSHHYWMHMTNEIEKNPIQFLKYARRWFKDNAKQQILFCTFDARNKGLLKMCKSFGFKVLNTRFGNNTLLLETVRLWQSQQ